MNKIYAKLINSNYLEKQICKSLDHFVTWLKGLINLRNTTTRNKLEINEDLMESPSGFEHGTPGPSALIARLLLH